ncbi:MAG: hypothetical protein ABIG63_09900, partial [Chloroflexota bacterium]
RQAAPKQTRHSLTINRVALGIIVLPPYKCINAINDAIMCNNDVHFTTSPFVCLLCFVLFVSPYP